MPLSHSHPTVRQWFAETLGPPIAPQREQYALPEAVTWLRKIRRQGEGQPLQVAAADPLNLTGILTPEPRVATTARSEVCVG